MIAKLSIIILTLNSERTIGRCLKSLGDQVFSSFEIIIQDCFSVDKTLPIVNSFKESHPALMINIQQFADSGIYHAMNLSLKRAVGEWIYFLGSDDYLHGHSVLSTVFSQALHNVDVIYGNVIRPDFRESYAGRFTTSMIYEQNICHQSIFLRRELFTRFGNFNNRYLTAADWDHNLRWFLDPSVSVIHINLDIANYSVTGISSTTSDLHFERDKPFLYLRYGSYSLSVSVKLSIIVQKLAESLRRRDWQLFVDCVIATRFLFIPSQVLNR